MLNNKLLLRLPLLISFAIANNLNAADEFTDESILRILLGAYNGAAQVYAQESGERATQITEADLAPLGKNLQDIQLFLQREKNDIDIADLIANIEKIQNKQGQLWGVNVEQVLRPLKLLQQKKQQGLLLRDTLKKWQQDNEQFIAHSLQNSGLIDKENFLLKDENQKALTILLGAGLALAELSKNDEAENLNSQPLNYRHAQNNFNELLSSNIELEIDDFIDDLKLVYANKTLGEELSARQLRHIQDDLDYIIKNGKGKLSKKQYNQIKKILAKLGEDLRYEATKWRKMRRELLGSFI